MTATPITSRTSNPCPSWCTEPAGHGYDCRPAGRPMRFHVGKVATLRPTLASPEDHAHICVSVTAAEVVLADGTAPEMGPPSIWLHLDEVHISGAQDLTAVEARGLAAILNNAADRLDDLNNDIQPDE